jgi:superoxide dismutase, Fe-Mn family
MHKPPTPQTPDAGAVLDRRSALATMGLFGAAATGFAGTVAQAKLMQDSDPTGGRGVISAAPGWNPAKAEYELTPLPYAYDALEPHIDAQTMEIHHSRHHAGYVNGLNNALRQLETARENSEASLVQHWQRQLSFHAGGHFNHALFWTGMAPAGKGGGGEASGTLKQAIQRDFGSYENFVWQFKQAANSVEASGWAWLIYEPTAGRLMISQMENQQKLLVPGGIPLLGIDVWEHAYYLRYQNRRAAYVDAFMQVIAWDEIQKRFDAASA